MYGNSSEESGAARLETARSIVIKVGSNLLVDSQSGSLRQDWLASLIADVAEWHHEGRNLLLVSSGAVALGRRILRLSSRQSSLEHAQASAAVGQIRLSQAYQQELAKHDIVAAQVLLTLEVGQHRQRYLNSRATLAQLLEFRCIPVINENDTVATDEICFGDNDRLAAQVAALAAADVLILLSDVDGLYDRDPRMEPDARHVAFIDELTPEILAMGGSVGTPSAKGGMKTKLLAARIAMRAGCAMVITRGNTEHPLKALRQGRRCTWFATDADPATARKQWIGSLQVYGKLYIDDGAVRAIRAGKSLLAAGVTGSEGGYQSGDCVEIVGPANEHIAQGLVAWDADLVGQIVGLRSDEIENLLGVAMRNALIHRDNMAI